MHKYGLFLLVGEKAWQGIGSQPSLGKLHHQSAKDEVICCQICTRARPEEQAYLCGGQS